MEMLRLAVAQDPAYAEGEGCFEASGHEGEEDEGTCGRMSPTLKRTERGQWVVPANDGIRTFLLSEAHDSITSGHFGEEKTWDKLRETWYWPGARRDVKEYVSTCPICLKVRATTQKLYGTLFPIPAHEPGQLVTLDFVSKFVPAQRTSYQQCLVKVDKFSRFVFLQGCAMTVTAQDTALYFLRRVIPILGVPHKVISDRGPQFTAAMWQEMLQLMGAQAALATAHHPQTDGQSERMVQNVIKLLRTYASEHRDR